MAISTNLEATLNAGEFKVLTRVSFNRCRLTVTGLSGEFTTIPFQTKTNGGVVTSAPFEAMEVKLLKIFKTIPSATILATTPQGVSTVDIVYDVRTGADA